MQCDAIWVNAQLATMTYGLGLIQDGFVAAKDGKIVYAGPSHLTPGFKATEIHDCQGHLITPALIDCHTHLIYGGDRAHEFAMRLQGATYQDIAKAGGGILSTMRATRDATEAELIDSAFPRLDALLAEGLGTIEIKSGYGLNLSDEIKMLKAAKALERHRNVRVITTLLAAHALPPEYANRSDDYIDLICNEIIPEVARLNLADSVDGFCETIGFSPLQISRVFEAATVHGLSVKLHAEQLSNQEGAVLAARYGALSADHLEHLSHAGISALAKSGTVATLLPGAYYFMRETTTPPIAGLRSAGVPIALATDHNPGTSPLSSLLLTMNMAATLFRMTVEECLLGVTRHAALALGLSDQIGTLEAGKACDLAIWSVKVPEQLVYPIGFNALDARVYNGQMTRAKT